MQSTVLRKMNLTSVITSVCVKCASDKVNELPLKAECWIVRKIRLPYHHTGRITWFRAQKAMR